MNGRKNQIVLVEVGHASLLASGIRRVEGKFGQKSFAARVAGRDLRKLYEVALADGGILVDALEMRRVPAADEIKFGGPARRLPVHKLYGVNKGGPILRCGRRWCEFRQSAHWVALRGHSVEDARGRGRPAPGRSWTTRNPATRSRGFSAQRRNASTSLMCAAPGSAAWNDNSDQA